MKRTVAILTSAVAILSAGIFTLHAGAVNATNSNRSESEQCNNGDLSGRPYYTVGEFARNFAKDRLMDQIERVRLTEEEYLAGVADYRDMTIDEIIKNLDGLVLKKMSVDEDYTYSFETDNGAIVSFTPGEVYAGGLGGEAAKVSYETGDGEETCIVVGNGRLHLLPMASDDYEIVPISGYQEVAEKDYYTIVVGDGKVATTAEVALLSLAIEYAAGENWIPMPQPPATEAFVDVGAPMPPPDNPDDDIDIGMPMPPPEEPKTLEEMLYVCLSNRFKDCYSSNVEEAVKACWQLSDESEDGRKINSEDVLGRLGYEYKGEKTGRPVSDAGYTVGDWTILVDHEQFYDDDGTLSLGGIIEIYNSDGDSSIVRLNGDSIEVYYPEGELTTTFSMPENISGYYVVKSAVSERTGRGDTYYDTESLAALMCIFDVVGGL